MVLQRGDKQPQSVEKTPDKNAKRREIYSQKIAADKNTLLSQRRLKDRESTSHRLLQNSASKKLMQSAISSYIPPVVGSTTQTRPTLRASSSLSQTLNEHRVFPSLPAPGGTTDAALPISVFEKGESSSISNKKSAPACEPPVTEGPLKRKRILMNISQLQSDYVPLKKIPNCKFCSEKKFQYESPGFCCATGTIKLHSHQMSTRLRNLYLGNTAECTF